MKKLFLTIPFLALPSLALAEMPQPFIGAAVGAGDTKVQVSRKRVNHIDLDAFSGQAGLNWKYARATVNYDYLPNKLANGHLFSGTVALQYPIGQFTPFVGVGGGYSYNRKQGGMPVYVATAGVEYAIDRQWSMEARYRYVHPVQHSAKPAHVVTVGIVFKF